MGPTQVDSVEGKGEKHRGIDLQQSGGRCVLVMIGGLVAAPARLVHSAEDEQRESEPALAD